VLSVAKARQILGKGCPFTDDEIEALVVQLHCIAALVINERAQSRSEGLTDG